MFAVHCEDLSLRYRAADGRETTALAGVSLSLSAGEQVAFVGANGSGKSTLALCLAGFYPPTGGKISVSPAPHSHSATVRRGAIVFQSPEDNLVAETVYDELALTLEYRDHTMPGRAEVIAACEHYGIGELADRELARLSGGEKQRVAVACALISERPLLILDEPTSHLDPPGRRALLRDLRDQVAGSDKPAVVFVTQYEGEAREFPRVVHLDSGKIVYDGPPSAWTGLGASGRASPGGWSAGVGRSPIVEVSALNQTDSPGWPCPADGLRGIDLTVHAGDRIGLCGPIGAGKSTLAFALSGLLKFADGSIHRGGERADPVVLIQFPERQLFAQTVGEDVAAGPRGRGLPEETCHEAARTALARVGLNPGEFSERSPFSLSGGEKRRAAIAGVVASGAPLYILDEPSAALDAQGQAALEGLCLNWSKEGRSYIVISHDLDLLESLTDRLWVMDRGRLIYDGHWADQEGVNRSLTQIGFASGS